MQFIEHLSPVILLRDEAGTSLTEYVLLASLFAVFCIIAWLAFGTRA
ncbi:hypothetical protein [Janthinobacterium sp. 17J80-10]|nr:hypothetical protein [Janthinobacterium sp. 17J80-10]